MKCEICGTEYKDSDRFCGMCGTPNPLLEVKAAPSENRAELYETALSDTENVNSNTEITDNQNINEAPEYQNTYDKSDTSDTSDGIFPDPTKPAVTEKPFDNISAAFCGNDENEKNENSNTADEDGYSSQGSEDYEKTENAETESPSIIPKKEETDGAVDNIPQGDTAAPKFDEPTKSQSNAYSEAYAVPTLQKEYPSAKAQKTPKPQKEKRVCSLSAVIVCIVIILILSVVCGVLGGLYLGEKARVRKLSGGRNGSVIAPYSYSEFFDKK